MVVETNLAKPLSSIGQEYFTNATAIPAVAVSEFIARGGFHTDEEIGKDVAAKRRVLVDKVGMIVMGWTLKDGPGNESFGSEGRKELDKYGVVRRESERVSRSMLINYDGFQEGIVTTHPLRYAVEAIVDEVLSEI